MNFVFDEFGDLDDEQVEWLRDHLRARGIVEASVDELIDADASMQAALSEINRLSANCAALLQRWAIIHNLFERGAPLESVAAVAQLSAEEVVRRGVDYCGERLIRQERAAGGLKMSVNYLEVDDIRRGSSQHQYLLEALHAMANYPQRYRPAPAGPSSPGKC